MPIKTHKSRMRRRMGSLLMISDFQPGGAILSQFVLFRVISWMLFDLSHWERVGVRAYAIQYPTSDVPQQVVLRGKTIHELTRNNTKILQFADPQAFPATQTAFHLTIIHVKT